MNTINLIEIAANLQSSAIKLHEKLLENPENPLEITASLLSKKYPELKALKSDLVLAKLRLKKHNDKSFIICDTLTAFKICQEIEDENNDVSIYGIENELIEFESYKTGYNGHCIVKIGKVKLKTKISCNDEHADHLDEENNSGYEGIGKPPLEALKLIPQPETPLNSLESGSKFQILKYAGKTRKYQTDMYDLKSLADDKILKNVISNKQLRLLWDKHSEKAQFEIGKKYESVSDKDEPILSKGKKSEEKQIIIVELIDLLDNYFDFDLDDNQDKSKSDVA
jgi:hypothetical protein